MPREVIAPCSLAEDAVAMRRRVVARKFEMNGAKPSRAPFFRHLPDRRDFGIDALIGDAVEAGDQAGAGFGRQRDTQLFKLRVMLEARIMEAHDNA